MLVEVRPVRPVALRTHMSHTTTSARTHTAHRHSTTTWYSHSNLSGSSSSTAQQIPKNPDGGGGGCCCGCCFMFRAFCTNGPGHDDDVKAKAPITYGAMQAYRPYDGSVFRVGPLRTGGRMVRRARESRTHASSWVF